MAHVSYVLYQGIAHVSSDSLLGRARACDGRGHELWRTLHAERKGNNDQVTRGQSAGVPAVHTCAPALGCVTGLVDAGEPACCRYFMMVLNTA